MFDSWLRSNVIAMFWLLKSSTGTIFISLFIFFFTRNLFLNIVVSGTLHHFRGRPFYKTLRDRVCLHVRCLLFFLTANFGINSSSSLNRLFSEQGLNDDQTRRVSIKLVFIKIHWMFPCRRAESYTINVN